MSNKKVANEALAQDSVVNLKVKRQLQATENQHTKQPDVPVFYSAAYIQSGDEFDTTRKAGWIALSLTTQPIAGLRMCKPQPLTAAELVIVHSSDYVRAVQTGKPRCLAESQGFTWDSGLWKAVCASNGGMVAAARHAMQHGVAGSLSSGLHHAGRDYGEGFCTFNGLALAAHAAVDAGASNVLILDLDAHCGGGTHSLISDDSRFWQLDVSVSEFDSYQPTERCRLQVVRTAAEYLPTIQRELELLERDAPRFDLCLYNAGMDPHENCSLGGLKGITTEIIRERDNLVFDWCRNRGIPIVFALAGGYVSPRLSQEALVALHRLTLEACRIYNFKCEPPHSN